MIDHARDHGGNAVNWAMILAGGFGRRLQPLTRLLSGDDRPKQYCSLFEGSTLLGATRTRVALSVSPLRTLCIVNREHQRYYREELADLGPAQLIEQPRDRGTAAAVAYGTARLHAVDADAIVGFFPADHYYASPGRFRTTVDVAYAEARRHPELVFLLGAEPDHAETDYGWIEPGEAILGADGVRAFMIARFWEKPVRALAQGLLERRAFWNTFVMVGHVDAFRTLLYLASPQFAGAFEALHLTSEPAVELTVADEIYVGLPAWDFSRDVVMSQAGHFAVIPLAPAGGTALGRPARVSALAGTAGLRFPSRLRTAS
jgi:mannose-1-phosphate guanylyltransferase